MPCQVQATHAKSAGGGDRRPGNPAVRARVAGPASIVLLVAALCASICGSALGEPRPRPAADIPRADARIPAGYLYAGELICVIGVGSSPVLGADRNLGCAFERRGAVAERYEGLSGIVATRSQAAETVVFAVWMPNPDALAALAGDYGGARLSPNGDGALVGGDGDAVVLTPVLGRAATDLEALNALLRLNQLHLNYGGRLPGKPRPR